MYIYILYCWSKPVLWKVFESICRGSLASDALSPTWRLPGAASHFCWWGGFSAERALHWGIQPVGGTGQGEQCTEPWAEPHQETTKEKPPSKSTGGNIQRNLQKLAGYSWAAYLTGTIHKPSQRRTIPWTARPAATSITWKITQSHRQTMKRRPWNENNRSGGASLG